MVKVYTCELKFWTPSGDKYEEVYTRNPDRVWKRYGNNFIAVTGYIETENWKRFRENHENAI